MTRIVHLFWKQRILHTDTHTLPPPHTGGSVSQYYKPYNKPYNTARDRYS